MDIQEIKGWKYPTRQMMREAIWWLIKRVEELEQRHLSHKSTGQATECDCEDDWAYNDLCEECRAARD